MGAHDERPSPFARRREAGRRDLVRPLITGGVSCAIDGEATIRPSSRLDSSRCAPLVSVEASLGLSGPAQWHERREVVAHGVANGPSTGLRWPGQRFRISPSTTPSWSLAANVVFGEQRLRFELDAASPLPRTHALPRSHDSRVEVRLETDLRRAASNWRIEREVAVIRMPPRDGTRVRLFFPDFALPRRQARHDEGGSCADRHGYRRPPPGPRALSRRSIRTVPETHRRSFPAPSLRSRARGSPLPRSDHH